MNTHLIAFDVTYGISRYTYKFYENAKKYSSKQLFVFEKNYPTKNADYVSLFVGLVIKDK